MIKSYQEVYEEQTEESAWNIHIGCYSNDYVSWLEHNLENAYFYYSTKQGAYSKKNK